MNKKTKYEQFFTMSVKADLTKEQIMRYVKPLYEEEGFKKVYDITKKKKMLPYVASMMLQLNLDKTRWASVLEKYKRRNSIVCQHLSDAYASMDDAGVNRIFISENFGALLMSGRDIGLFASGDCDSCADFSEKSKIDSVFKKLGYTNKDIYFGRDLCYSSYHNSDILPDDFYFGICWEPLFRLKLPCFINMDDFVNWDSLNKLEGTSIKLPSSEALLYISLMHITLHSFCRAPAIRLYADILNCCHAQYVDWEKVYEWACRDKTVIRMMTSAILANKLTGVHIPNFVKAYENNRRVRRLLRLVYDFKNNCLKPEPGKLLVYAIEIACNDRNFIRGLLSIIYPGTIWLKTHYGHGVILSTLIHLKNLL